MSYPPKKINSWLKRYHSNLELNSAGICYLAVDNELLNIVISLSPDKCNMMFYCPIISITRQDSFWLALEALALNLYQDVALRGALGYDDRTGKLAYTFVINSEHNGKAGLYEYQFHKILKDFIDNSKKLVERFTNLQETNGHSPRISPTDSLARKQWEALVSNLKTEV